MNKSDAAYYNFCEEIYQSWLKQDFESKHDRFDYNYVPEPYTCQTFEGRQLVFVNNNPGAKNCFQHRDYFSQPSNNERIKNLELASSSDYMELATKLGAFYSSELKEYKLGMGTGAASSSRVDNQKRLTEKLGFDNFISVELFPFHSKGNDELKGKSELFKDLDKLHQLYHSLLADFLSDKSVIYISAGHGKVFSLGGFLSNRWHIRVAELIGMNLDELKIKELNKSDIGNVSVALVYSKSKNVFKATSLRWSTNNLPSKEHYADISKALQF